MLRRSAASRLFLLSLSNHQSCLLSEFISLLQKSGYKRCALRCGRALFRNKVNLKTKRDAGFIYARQLTIDLNQPVRSVYYSNIVCTKETILKRADFGLLNQLLMRVGWPFRPSTNLTAGMLWGKISKKKS